MTALEHYREVLRLTDEMKLAASGGEWEQLVSLERQRSDLLVSVQRLAITETERQPVADIIRSVLDSDAQTERLAAAWVGELRGMFSSMTNERRLLKSYLA